MRNLVPFAVSLSFAASLAGCSFHARGPEKYRDDTRAVLETKLPEIKACYDGMLKSDKSLSGEVKVNFTVEAETGAIKEMTVDQGGTTAPQGLSDCVSNSLQGLTLDPPDARDGIATFTYSFNVG